MTCPYCVQPVLRGSQAVWIGPHRAHASCQRRQEMSGRPYLIKGGEMRFGAHTIPARAANAMIELFARTVRERRRELRKG